MTRWLMFTSLYVTEVDAKRPEFAQEALGPAGQVREGDFVYLVFGGLELYATGRLFSIERRGLNDQGYERLQVTVSQQFGKRMVSFRELRVLRDLDLLLNHMTGDSNFVPLMTRQVIALNWALRPQGFHAPDDDDIDTKLYLAAERYNLVSVLFMDLDNFGQVNKNHGHAVGDNVIRESLAVAQRVLPNGGLVQRLGDQRDEFKFLLGNLTEQDARAVAENVRTAIETNTFAEVGRGRITATIGVATYPETCEDLDDLFNEADRAAGRAKTKGLRNRVTTCRELLDDAS
jgi:diguanylate cyclase (GGDEF)-like protein